MNQTPGTAAVIGAGLIGKAWAIVFARAGWKVRLYDTSEAALEAAVPAIRTQLQMMQEQGMVDDPESALACISLHSTLEDVAAGVDYVQECGPEIEEVKAELFAELDRLVPAESVIASSTSAIVASKFSGNLAGRHRMLVAHPVNPPHLVPLVEIGPAEWTSEATVKKATDIMHAVRQSPILVKKEIDGFILNRLQAALLNEAVRLVQGGYVSPADLDKTLCDGLGLRWSFMGPFETIDLNAPAGVRDYAERYSPFFKRIVESQSSIPDWHGESLDEVDDYCRELLDVDQIAERSDWRDSRLAALRAHKDKSPGRPEK